MLDYCFAAKMRGVICFSYSARLKNVLSFSLVQSVSSTARQLHFILWNKLNSGEQRYKALMSRSALILISQVGQLFLDDLITSDYKFNVVKVNINLGCVITFCSVRWTIN